MREFSMRIAVMGTGGVGGYFGARLAASGCDVEFIARGAHLAAIRERGLRVESPLGDAHIAKPKATDDPAKVGKVDIVLFGVKLWDTEAAASAIPPMVGPGTAVVSFQNGVHKDEVLRRVVGEQAVMGGVCYIAATIAEPGVVRHAGKMQKLVFGEYDGSRSGRAEAFLDACQRAQIEAEISADIRRTIWEKFVFLVGLSGTTATIRMPIGPIRSNEQTRAFLLDAMREVVAIGRAAGVGLAENFADGRLAFCDGLLAEMTSSMHQDLERANRLEVQWLSGDVVKRGNAAAIPTPVNRAIYDILALHADGKRGT
jgi:2-dehydropantoate 2-reductase